MHPSLTHILDRTIKLRRQIENERHRRGARPSHLLRLQALFLRAQKQLADMLTALPVAPR